MPEPSPPLRQPPLHSLATRIISVVFLATFLTALVVSWISVHSTYAFLRRQVDTGYPVLLGAAAQRARTWLDEGRGALEELARDAALRGALAPGLESPAVAGTLDALLADHPHFEALLLTDPSGALRTARGSGPERWPAHLAPPEDAGLLALSLEGRGILPAASVVLRHPSGATMGTLYGIFREDVLRTELLEPGLGPNVQIYALDEHGRARWARDQAPLPTADFPLEPGGGTAIYRNGAGVFVVGATHAFGSWRLVLEQPFQDAFEPVFSVVTRVFVIDLCIILLFSFLAYQVTAAVVRPIEALSEGARRISQGRLGIEIPEPPGQDEVGLLTRTFNDMTRKLLRSQGEIQTANAKLKAQNDELQRANEVLEQLSITDGLTKLHNHRFFQDYLTREIKRVSRTREPLSILLLDIDDFKRLNDRLGHAAGDELLVRIARILNDTIRESDLVARYGGEEFVVLAPDTDVAGAISLAEKIRTAIAESSFILDDSKQLTKMTVSVGVAEYRGNRKTFFLAADQALYRAKASGKNCVVADEDPGGDADPRSA